MNRAVLEFIETNEIPHKVVDLSPGELERSFRYYFQRLCRFFGSIFAVLLWTIVFRKNVVYMGVSGGMGQVLDLPFVIIARLTLAKIVIHHHSFACINKPNAIARILFWFAGSSSTHIVLCECMGDKLSNTYKSVEVIFLMSNVPFLDELSQNLDEKSKRQKAHGVVLGFLSNITLEKGISEFLEIYDLVANENPNVSAIIAGPCSDKESRILIDKAERRHSDLKYVGPIYGSEKKEFFEKCDVFVFPSKYRHEAEPLVIHEALAHGCPVVATTRGCLTEMLDEDCSILIHDYESEKSNIVKNLTKWISNEEALKNASMAAIEKFKSHRNDARSSKEDFLRLVRR